MYPSDQHEHAQLYIPDLHAKHVELHENLEVQTDNEIHHKLEDQKEKRPQILTSKCDTVNKAYGFRQKQTTEHQANSKNYITSLMQAVQRPAASSKCDHANTCIGQSAACVPMT